MVTFKFHHKIRFMLSQFCIALSVHCTHSITCVLWLDNVYSIFTLNTHFYILILLNSYRYFSACAKKYCCRVVYVLESRIYFRNKQKVANVQYMCVGAIGKNAWPRQRTEINSCLFGVFIRNTRFKPWNTYSKALYSDLYISVIIVTSVEKIFENKTDMTLWLC